MAQCNWHTSMQGQNRDKMPQRCRLTRLVTVATLQSLPSARCTCRLLNLSAALAGSEHTLRLLHGAKCACGCAIAAFKNTPLFSGPVVAQLPQEFLEGMAAFAAGLRPWAEWHWWFNVHAARLVRLLERQQFQQLKHDPVTAVALLLREHGVSIRVADPEPPAVACAPVTAEEYEIYTAVCRQLDLFQFDRPDTTFEDQTNRDVMERLPPRLEYDAPRKEYCVVQPGLAEKFSEPFREWFRRCPEMVRDYAARNRQRWPLAKRFAVPNGYRFVSELAEHESERAQGAFCLSRVGFSADARFTLVFLRYAVTCAYYLVMERSQGEWRRAEFYGAWVS